MGHAQLTHIRWFKRVLLWKSNIKVKHPATVGRAVGAHNRRGPLQSVGIATYKRRTYSKQCNGSSQHCNKFIGHETAIVAIAPSEN